MAKIDRHIPPPKFKPGDLVRFKPGFKYLYPVDGTVGEVQLDSGRLRTRYTRRGWRYPVHSFNLGIVRRATEQCLELLPPLADPLDEELIEEKDREEVEIVRDA